MKRIAVLLASLLAAVALVVGFAPAAHAEVCEFEVPELPGECLTLPVYEHLVKVHYERDVLRIKYEAALEQVGTLRAENAALIVQRNAADSQRAAALVERDGALAARDEAVALAQARWTRILVLRGKLKELRLIIHG